MCIMKCPLHHLRRGPEYENCILLQEILLGLLIFILLLLHNEGVHKYGLKKALVLEAAWLETPDSIRKSINLTLFLPRAFYHLFLFLQVFISLFKPHKDIPKSTREKEENDPCICERPWSFF